MHYHNAALNKLCYTASASRYCPSVGADPQRSAARAKAACFHLPSSTVWVWLCLLPSVGFVHIEAKAAQSAQRALAKLRFLP